VPIALTAFSAGRRDAMPEHGTRCITTPLTPNTRSSIIALQPSPRVVLWLPSILYHAVFSRLYITPPGTAMPFYGVVNRGRTDGIAVPWTVTLLLCHHFTLWRFFFINKRLSPPLAGTVVATVPPRLPLRTTLPLTGVLQRHAWHPRRRLPQPGFRLLPTCPSSAGREEQRRTIDGWWLGRTALSPWAARTGCCYILPAWRDSTTPPPPGIAVPAGRTASPRASFACGLRLYRRTTTPKLNTICKRLFAYLYAPAPCRPRHLPTCGAHSCWIV